MKFSSAIVVSCVYPPQPFTSARTSRDIARYFINHVSRVVVICPADGGPASVDRGMTILRTFQSRSVRSRLVSRFVQNVTFGVSSAWRILLHGEVDIVYVNSWPLFAQAFVVWASRICRGMVIRSIQDLYPESIVAQGRVRRGSFASLLMQNIDEWVAGMSDVNVFIGEGLRSVVGLSSPRAARSIILPNWVSGSSVTLPSLQRGRAKMLLTYAGNLGVASGLQVWLPLILRALGEAIMLRIMGGGALLEEIRRVTSKEPSRVELITPWPAGEIGKVAESDVGLLTMLPGQAGASIPSKFLTYIECGLPVLVLGGTGSEIVNIVRENNIGWAIDMNEETGSAMKAIFYEIQGLSMSSREAMRARVLAISKLYNASGALEHTWKIITERFSQKGVV